MREVMSSEPLDWFIFYRLLLYIIMIVCGFTNIVSSIYADYIYFRKQLLKKIRWTTKRW